MRFGFISLQILRVQKLYTVIFYPILRTAFFKHLVMAGVEHKAVLSRPLLTVIDIGANRGQFALAVRAISDAKVISFEPLPGPASVFRKVFAGDQHVLLHQAAIGPRPEQKTMHVSGRDDSSSLLPISSVQTTMFPGSGEVTTAEVRVGRLEEFVKAAELGSPALLKLDVQGFEYEALVGCESLLSHFDWVYCECSFVEFYSGQKLAWKVIDWCTSKGFQLVGIYNPAYDRCGKAIQADFLFERNATTVAS